MDQARIAAQAAVEAAAGEPVLILVDDLDWRDKEYIEVLVQVSLCFYYYSYYSRASVTTSFPFQVSGSTSSMVMPSIISFVLLSG